MTDNQLASLALKRADILEARCLAQKTVIGMILQYLQQVTGDDLHRLCATQLLNIPGIADDNVAQEEFELLALELEEVAKWADENLKPRGGQVQ